MDKEFAKSSSILRKRKKGKEGGKTHHDKEEDRNLKFQKEREPNPLSAHNSPERQQDTRRQTWPQDKPREMHS